MPEWLRKTLVAMVTILTLGTVVPASGHYAPSNKDQSMSSNGEVEKKAASGQDGTETAREAVREEDEEAGIHEGDWDHLFKAARDSDELAVTMAAYVKEKARIQGMKKFGSQIASKIGTQYDKEILPAFEQAITRFGASENETIMRRALVSEDPSSGWGERIINLYDSESGDTLVKFHVRRDHPPLDGYYFNFHYHTYKDNFETHHALGKIYWDKNTPPAWA